MNRFAICTFDHSLSLNKVRCIKAVRGITFMGLRDAKNVADRAYDDRPQEIKISESLGDSDLKRYIKLGREGGLIISVIISDTPVRREIAVKLKEVLSYAIISNQTDIVLALTNIINFNLPKDSQDKG